MVYCFQLDSTKNTNGDSAIQSKTYLTIPTNNKQKFTHKIGVSQIETDIYLFCLNYLLILKLTIPSNHFDLKVYELLYFLGSLSVTIQTIIRDSVFQMISEIFSIFPNKNQNILGYSNITLDENPFLIKAKYHDNQNISLPFHITDSCPKTRFKRSFVFATTFIMDHNKQPKSKIFPKSTKLGFFIYTQAKLTLNGFDISLLRRNVINIQENDFLSMNQIQLDQKFNIL
ncbi:hypothetical protein M0811_07649 [Anaeramoeba ignava]|uniref:Uncharacterized protein n=1 Tax=Anaeramoeba ignava TaxID=1746090 RepID=A0A9Q0LPK9_ANAIG|nr:hypothetical protein M0811_07649 [Anaeramoeba ignava]